jgi:RNA polymerase sigma factor (sigma-70 family)
MSEVIEHLRRAVFLWDRPDMTDGQLLERFISNRDESALAAIVRRHGPMVWGVCRRVLSNHHDAEDAFQATFLVLVRNATSIRQREMVANWLYGVAHQTSLKARAMMAKRRAREKQGNEMPELKAVAEPDLWRDLQPLLDQELSRLPDKYRVAIVLCDLEGKKRKEVARQLKIREGTLSSRLTMARRMLAKRLGRHGLGVSGGALAAMLSQNASASVPTSMVSSTIKAAMMFAAGQAAATGAISARVAALTEGVLKTMLLTKLKTAMAVLLVVAIVGVGSGGLFYRTQAAEPASPQREGQTTEDSQPSLASIAKQLQKLQKTVDGLREEVKGLRANLGRGPDRPSLPAPPSLPGSLPVRPGSPGGGRPPENLGRNRPAPDNVRNPPVPDKRDPQLPPDDELRKPPPAPDNELQKTVDALREEVGRLRATLKQQRLDEEPRRPLPPPERKDNEKRNRNPIP